MKMENLAPHDGWILKFFSGELSEKEELAFVEWMNQDELNRKYVADFNVVWNLSQLKNSAGCIDIDKEWLKLSHKVLLPGMMAVGNSADEMKEVSTARASVVTLWKNIAVAAAVVMVVSLGLVFYYAGSKQTGSPPLVHTMKTIREAKSERLHHEVNTSGKTRIVNLSDGTSVRLYDKSELVYDENFAINKRALLLSGRAYFKVAKDPKKPFVVTTEMLATTAIGTEFEVRAFKKEKRIVVRLYEGKVAVSSPTLKTWNKDLYLAPGDEVVYLLDKNLLQVNRFLKQPGQNVAEAVPSLPFDTKGSWYMFNNESLEQVLEQLQELYSTPIIYSKKDIKNMYFIGKFKKDDPLEVILKRICMVNGLKLRFEGDRYQIDR